MRSTQVEDKKWRKIFDSNILKAEGEWIRPRLQSSSFFSTFVSTAGVLFP